ncbi:hypothetical protein PC129_g5624 [Phytophthora cactorum]|uniref:Uncharacterized protein n=1 Tax=Phytophthora cactorum TaxID=29920 RepID=A0A329SCR9_9STRA|nr:hypothetical protein Pcac1_g8669 [Phytophthora cactorum]KAG2830061.1 hypothetical protein PC111_g7524 [Phytophthora cactorum]KAG2832675.1 hypothetical protein PC112_g6805 [Phytophthora cactorum]KAG2864856.1 hypothetical protein PC113_g4195 [Phytophthora cactorum]KAG2911481.1 hypothetical protein PC114_g9340 [Phytophthora cactorum]
MALNSNAFSTSYIPEEMLFFFDVYVIDETVKCPSKPKQAWKTGYSNL